jgi:hypothetical protein
MNAENDENRFTPEEQEQLKKVFDDLDKMQEKMRQEYFPPGFARQRTPYYKLDENKNPVPCSTYEFTMQQEQFEKFKRVAKTQLGPYTVSTVFLSIDHNWGGKGPPVLFETMIWSDKQTDKLGEFFNFQTRYCTWEEAIAGHESIVAMVNEGLLP